MLRFNGTFKAFRWSKEQYFQNIVSKLASWFFLSYTLDAAPSSSPVKRKLPSFYGWQKTVQIGAFQKIPGLQFGINGLCGWLVSYFWNACRGHFLASAFSVFLWILNQRTIKQQQSGVKQTLLRVKMLRVEVNEVNISFSQKPPQISHSNLRRIKKTSQNIVNLINSWIISSPSEARSCLFWGQIRFLRWFGLPVVVWGSWDAGLLFASDSIFLVVKRAHFRNGLGLRRWCGGGWVGCLDPWMEAASCLWMPGRDESRPTMCE